MPYDMEHTDAPVQGPSPGVWVPLSLFMQMAETYWGGGPTYYEKKESREQLRTPDPPPRPSTMNMTPGIERLVKGQGLIPRGAAATTNPEQGKTEGSDASAEI